MSRLFTRDAYKRSRAFISVAILLALTMLAPLMVVSAPLTSVFVNGVRVDAYPVIHDGVAYLPIQVMAQAMEAEIIWDAKLGTVKVNGVHSPATVYNQNGKVLLPIESFITGLGGNVVYDGRNNMIRVETPDYMANGPSLANGTTASELGGSAHKNNSNSGNHGTTPSIAPAVISTAGTTAALATQSAANGTAIGAQTVTSAGSAIGTQTATAARYSQPTSTGSSYGTYGSPASSSYGTPAASGQAAYGSPASAVQPAYGTPASTAQSSYSIPAGDSTAINTSGSNFMPPQSTYTVKPSFRPPYTAGAQQTATTAYNTPGTMPSSNAVITGTAPNVGINPIPSLSQAGNSPYIPRTAQNAVFKVTVSNLEVVPVIKDFYKPRTGSKFVVASLSQQNISNQVQIYTGKFSLVDQNQNSYDHLEGLSNFWLVILRPFGVNFGYLVFEIPQNAKPMYLVLHALNQAPLTISL